MNHSTPSTKRSLPVAASAWTGSQSACSTPATVVAPMASTQPSAQTAIGAPNAPSLLHCTPAATSASVTGFPIGSWTQAPPRSTFPGPSGTVWIRPPRRSRASATTTSAPAQRAASAAARPAIPAPTTTTRMQARLSPVWNAEYWGLTQRRHPGCRKQLSAAFRPKQHSAAAWQPQRVTCGVTWAASNSIWRRSSPSGQKCTRRHPAFA